MRIDVDKQISALYYHHIYDHFCEVLCELSGYFLPNMFSTRPASDNHTDSYIAVVKKVLERE